SKVQRPADMNDLLAVAGKYSLVAGFQGKQARQVLREEFSPGRYKKDYGPPGDKARIKDKRGRKPEEKKEEKKGDSPLVLRPELVPYKPLVMMKTALLTLDINKGYTATVKFTFADKEATDDGETALKSALYVLRELAAMAPKMEREFRPLTPLSEL